MTENNTQNNNTNNDTKQETTVPVSNTEDKKLNSYAKKVIAGTAVGVAVVSALAGWGISSAIKPASVTIDGKSYSQEDALKDLSKNSTVVSQYKTNVLKKALDSKYSSKSIDAKVNSEYATLRSTYSTNAKWSSYLSSQGFTSNQDAKDAIRYTLLLQKYIESKVDNSAVKEAYSTWIPNQSVTVKMFETKAEAQKSADDYNKTDGSGKDKVSTFSDKNEYVESVINSETSALTKSDVKKVYDGKVGDATVVKTNVTASNGKNEYAVILLKAKTNKGSYSTEKANIKTALQNSVTTSSKNFGKDLVKDLNIKGQDSIGKAAVKSLQGTSTSSSTSE